MNEWRIVTIRASSLEEYAADLEVELNNAEKNRFEVVKIEDMQCVSWDKSIHRSEVVTFATTITLRRGKVEPYGEDHR